MKPFLPFLDNKKKNHFKVGQQGCESRQNGKLYPTAL